MALVDRAITVDDKVERDIVPPKHLSIESHLRAQKRQRCGQVVGANLVQDDPVWCLACDLPTGHAIPVGTLDDLWRWCKRSRSRGRRNMRQAIRLRRAYGGGNIAQVDLADHRRGVGYLGVEGRTKLKEC